MAEEQLDGSDDTSKRSRLRSPNYPVLGLPMAIQNACKIYQQEGNVPVPSEALLRDLGFSGPTAPALRTVAALKTYGLLVEQGGEYRLTDDALQVMQLGEGDPERQASILRLCDRPEIFQQLKKKYPEGLPSDRTIKIVLVKEWGFSDAAADGVLAAFRQTMAFVKQVTGAPDDKSAADRSVEVMSSLTLPVVRSNGGLAFTPPAPPVAPSRPSAAAALVHVWSLGGGVTVELRSNAPLASEHFELLSEYVKLARRAALGPPADQDPPAEEKGFEPLVPFGTAVFKIWADACSFDDAKAREGNESDRGRGVCSLEGHEGRVAGT